MIDKRLLKVVSESDVAPRDDNHYAGLAAAELELMGRSVDDVPFWMLVEYGRLASLNNLLVSALAESVLRPDPKEPTVSADSLDVVRPDKGDIPDATTPVEDDDPDDEDIYARYKLPCPLDQDELPPACRPVAAETPDEPGVKSDGFDIDLNPMSITSGEPDPGTNRYRKPNAGVVKVRCNKV